MKKIFTSLMALCVIASTSFASLQYDISGGMLRNDADYLQDPLFIFKLQKNVADLNIYNGYLGAGVGLAGPVRLGFYLRDKEAMSSSAPFVTTLLTNFAGIGTNARVTTTTSGMWSDTSTRSLNAVVGFDGMKLGILGNFAMNQSANGGSLDMTGSSINSTLLEIPVIAGGALSNRLSTNYGGGINNNSSYVLTLTPAMMVGDLMLYLPITGTIVNARSQYNLSASNEFVLASTPSNFVSNQVNLNDTSTLRIGIAPMVRMVSTADNVKFELMGQLSASLGFMGTTTAALDYRSASTNITGGAAITHAVSNVGYRSGYMSLPLSLTVSPTMVVRVTDKVKFGTGALLSCGYSLVNYGTANTNFNMFITNTYVRTITTPAEFRTNVSTGTWSASAAAPLYTEVALADFITLRIGGVVSYNFSSTTTTTVVTGDDFRYTTTATNTGGGSVVTNYLAPGQNESGSASTTYSSALSTVFGAGLSFAPTKDFQIDMTLAIYGGGADIMNTANWGLQAIYRF